MLNKKDKRLRRARKTRAIIKKLQIPRLVIHRTPRHIYAQIVMPDGVVKACASTLEQAVKQQYKGGGNIKAAVVVGELIAQKAQKADISNVAYDRSGFKYHGRVKALADAARQNGLVF